MKGADNPSVDRRSVLRATGAVGVTTGLAALAGCLDDPTDDGDDADELVITQGEIIENPDPNDHITGPYFNVLDPVYEPLFNVTPEFEFEPRVVEDWEDTDDGAELTIRDDVVFHNGDEMTAEDVAYTFNRMIDPEEGIESDQAAGLGAIDNAEALDDTTVLLEHEVAPSLAEFEYANYGRVVNQEWIEDQDEQPIAGDDEEAFNGTGPYEVVEYEPDVQVVLEPFDDYWGDEATLERVVFNQDDESSGRANALETGESDIVDNIIPEDVPGIDDADGVEIREETSLRNIFLVMKSGVEPFDSLEFRQAMNYAVDNQGIIEDSLGGYGEAMTQPIPDGVFGHDPDLDPYEQDLEQAEELVEESGYAGEEITLYSPEGRYLNDADVAEMAADQIDQLDNVDCNFDTAPFPDISDANSAGFDDEEMPFFLIGWGVITGDSDYGLAPFFTEDSPQETLRNEDISDMILESQTIEDEDEREAQLQEINAELREEAPWVFLHSQDSVYGVRDDLDWEPRTDESIYLWEIDS